MVLSSQNQLCDTLPSRMGWSTIAGYTYTIEKAECVLAQISRKFREFVQQGHLRLYGKTRS